VRRLVAEKGFPQGFERGAVKDEFTDADELAALDEQLGKALHAGRIDAKLSGDLRDGLLERERLESRLGEEACEAVACRLLLRREGDPVSGESKEVLLGDDLLPIDEDLQNGPGEVEREIGKDAIADLFAGDPCLKRGRLMKGFELGADLAGQVLENGVGNEAARVASNHRQTSCAHKAGNGRIERARGLPDASGEIWLAHPGRAGHLDKEGDPLGWVSLGQLRQLIEDAGIIAGAVLRGSGIDHHSTANRYER
jgi:hypothetical protein